MRTMTRWLTIAAVAMLMAAPSMAQETEKGTGDGIKVHGHWTVDVKNADGTVALHRDFENALAGGRIALSKLMGHQVPAAYYWQVAVVGSGLAVDSIALLIVEPSTPLGGGDASNLTVSIDQNDHVVLQGSVQSAGTGAIESVESRFLSQQDLSNPFTISLIRFSSKDLTASPITVQAGQTIQITVDFSFS